MHILCINGGVVQINGLETFLAIVETGSLVRAAERLNVSQSAVTARLKTLEADLGKTLVHRRRTGVELTAAGRTFKRYAEAMTSLWSQAQQDVSLPDAIDAVCNIGCHTELWSGVGRRLVDLIHRTQPNAAWSAWPGDRDDLSAWLRSGQVDLALTYEPVAQANQTVRTIHVDRLILVSTQEDGPMRFDPGYVFVDAGEDFARDHAAAYADADTAKVSYGSPGWALDHLLSHGGSAYLPERVARPQLDAGSLFALSGAPEFARTAYLITAESADWPWLDELITEFDRTEPTEVSSAK